jgi:outer membrane protein assembly factor BamA
MHIRVRERKPRFATIRTGAGQSEFRAIQWDIEGQAGQRNFFGYRKYDLTARYSFGFGEAEKARLLTHEYVLRYTEPRPFNFRLPLSTSVTWQPPLADEVLDIELETWRLTFETRRRNLGKWNWGVGAEYIWTTLTQLNSTDPVQSASSERQQRRKGFVEVRFDNRDHLFVPSRGVLGQASFEQFGGPLGGSGNFVKSEVSVAGFTEISGGLISASRLSYGIARPSDDNTLSFADEVLFTGGANSVRGFRENRLGPVDASGDPTGARYVLTANQEFRWQTVPIFKYIPGLNSLLREFPLWQSLFVDMGNGFSEAEEIRLDNFAYSVGTGVQLITPAGPLRLDYARVIQTNRFSSQERFHFTILYAF